MTIVIVRGAGERSDGENQRKRRKAVALWLRFQFHNIVSVLGKMQSMKCLHFPRSLRYSNIFYGKIQVFEKKVLTIRGKEGKIIFVVRDTKS